MKNMDEIQIYNRAENPVLLTGRVRYDPSRSIEQMLTVADRHLVEAHWKQREQQGFRDNEMGSLWNTQNGLHFISTRFRIYDAIASYRARGENPFSAEVVENTRTSNVAVLLETSDGMALLQQRAPHLLAGGKLDSSASGGCVVRDGKLDLIGTILAKIEAELGLDTADIELTPTGVHRALDYTTIQVTYQGRVNRNLKEIMETANPRYVQKIEAVPKKELRAFTAHHYTSQQDMIGDACATILSSLPIGPFEEFMAELNGKGAQIRCGTLREGVFVPE